MSNYKKYLMLVSFLVYIFGFFVLYLVSPKQDTSYFENRKLAEVPVFSLDKLLSSELFKEYETYFTDHFPKRDAFVKVYKQYEIASTSTFVGDFYITEDNWILFKPVTTYDGEAVKQGANAVNTFSKEMGAQGTEVYYISLPAKMNTIDIPYPEFVEKSLGQEKKAHFLKNLDKDVNVLNMGEVLAEKYSQDEINHMFFKTDHHWNASGAYASYVEIVNYLQVDKDGQSKDYKKTCLQHAKFFGSWNKQLSGLVNADDEEICQYVPTSERTDFYQSQLYKTADITGPTAEWTGIYAAGFHKNSPKIDYGQLFSADTKLLRVINDKQSGGEKVLIIKDSFTNAIFPYLSNHFYDTTIYDIRHNEEGNLTKLINENDFDKILILYNDSNLDGAMYNFK